MAASARHSQWSVLLTGALLACLTIDSPAQDPAAATPDIPALIRQLGASRVRLRDEADAALRNLPQAEAELRAIAEANPNDEAGLRALAILKIHRSSLWTVTASVAAPPPPPGARYTMLRHACASPDGKFVVSMFSGGALVSDGQSAEQLRVVGLPGIMSGADWEGVRRAVAVSPDSKWIASTDDAGRILIDDFDGKRVKTIGETPAAVPPVETALTGVPDSATFEVPRPLPSGDPFSSATLLPAGDSTPRPSIPLPPPALPPQTRIVIRSNPMDPNAIVWGLHFLPGGKELLYANLKEGLVRCHLETGEKKIFPLQNLRPRSLAVTPDGKTAALGTDPLNVTCHLQTIDLETMTVGLDVLLKTIPNAVSITRDGARVFVGQNDGSLWMHTPADGKMKVIASFTKAVNSLALSADERTLYVASIDAGKPLAMFDTESLKETWAAPPAPQGFHSVVVLDENRIATTSNDCFLQIWRKRQDSKPAAGR